LLSGYTRFAAKNRGSDPHDRRGRIQASLLAREGVVIARDRSRVPIAFDTICIHAGMEGAVERLRAIRASFGAKSR